MPTNLPENRPTPLPFPFSKRIFDLIFSVILGVLLLPILILILFLFAFESLLFPTSRGPFFYREQRISGGQIINFYKFRIFKTSALKDYFRTHGFIQTKALENDKNNLTLLGRLLKQIYFDELPQLWCVLKGDMTLVGARPSNLPVSFGDLKSGRIQRWIFKCGITGDFQINKHSPQIFNQAKIDTDYAYFCQKARWYKIWKHDFIVILKSILTVLQAKGY